MPKMDVQSLMLLKLKVYRILKTKISTTLATTVIRVHSLPINQMHMKVKQ